MAGGSHSVGHIKYAYIQAEDSETEFGDGWLRMKGASMRYFSSFKLRTVIFPTTFNNKTSSIGVCIARKILRKSLNTLFYVYTLSFMSICII